jgi:hypothetical protein
MYWTIKTTQSVDEVINLLKGLTDKQKNNSVKQFKGSFNEHKFKLTLIRRYRAPFKPIVYGNVKADANNNNQTNLYLTISPNTTQILIFILLFGIFLSFSNIFSLFGQSIPFDNLFYIGVFIVIIAIGIALYKYESRKIIDIIKTSLEHKK